MRIELTDLILRDLEPTDDAAMALLANDRTVWIHLRDRMPYPYTIEDARWFIGHARSPGREIAWAIEVQGAFAGVIGLERRGDVHRYSAEIGYWLGAPFRGRGLGTRAVRALVEHAFATTDLLRIDADVFSTNPASARVLEKAGFVREGVRRADVVKDGAVLDAHLWARLRPDLPARWPEEG
jgi:RimJ/RimL family protein N-acetyltransferase